MEQQTTTVAKTYIIEHLDPELGPWSSLEYQAIAKECSEAGSRVCLSSIPKLLDIPPELHSMKSLLMEHRSVEEIYERDRQRVCLLDPAAKQELMPEDGDAFDIFLFGGILGDDPPRGTIRQLTKELSGLTSPRQNLGTPQ